jgi:hypothetical protein
VYSGDVVEHAFPAPGTYQVCLTFQGVCASDTQCEVISVTTTGLDEHHTMDGIRLWPQPANDLLHLSSEQPMHAVEVLDASGRLVLHQVIDHRQQVDMDLSGFPAGVFVLRAWTSTSLATRVLVKE